MIVINNTGMKEYKLIVKSKLYMVHYTICAKDLVSASKLAKMRFLKRYKFSGEDIKVQLDSSDLKNHIDEILDRLHDSK